MSNRPPDIKATRTTRGVADPTATSTATTAAGTAAAAAEITRQFYPAESCRHLPGGRKPKQSQTVTNNVKAKIS
jgi:hypothetical protein